MRQEATMLMGACIRARMALSVAHIQAAALFARQAYRLEQTPADEVTGDVRDEHRAYVCSSVIASASFLEATINEFYADAADKEARGRLPVGSDTIALLEEFWNLFDTRKAGIPILTKYQFALAATGRPKMDAGARPYQEVAGLINIRNALVHYVPEWTGGPGGALDGEGKASEKLEKGLARRFDLNPFLRGEANAFFPDKCLGHGCAAWGVRYSVEFVEEFCQRMGLKPAHAEHYSQLSTR